MKAYVDKVTGEFFGFYSDKNPAIPEGAIAVDGAPDDGRASYDLVNKTWKPYDPPYDEKRKAEYLEKLGDQGNQNDAIYKGVTALLQVLVDKQLVTTGELQDLDLLPDKNAPLDTPAGWLGRIKDIKQRFPKD